MSVRMPSSEEAQGTQAQELAAERRGADRVRAQVRDILVDARRIVRLGEHQIEVIEVAALRPLLEDSE